MVILKSEAYSNFWLYSVTLRNWFLIFFLGFETVLINSFIDYRDLEHHISLSHKEYCMLVAWDLVICSPRITTGSGSFHSHYSAAHRHAIQVTIPSSDDNIPIQHLPVSVSKPERQVCFQCWQKQKGGGGSKNTSSYLPKTQWKCVACNLPFCHSFTRDYFLDYHR